MSKKYRNVLVCCEPSLDELQYFVEHSNDPLIFRFYKNIEEVEHALENEDSAVIVDFTPQTVTEQNKLEHFLKSKQRSIYVIGILQKVRSDLILRWLDVGADDLLFNLSLRALLPDALGQWQAVRNADDEEKARLFFRHRYTLAERLQNAILYRSFEQIQSLNLDSSILFKPQSGNLSGDYYSFRVNTKNEMELFLADAIGHGINAAMLTLEIDRIVRQSYAISDLNLRMQYLNEEWNKLPGRKTFFSGFSCKIDKRKITYISAGHPSGYLVKEDGSIESLFTGGKLLGIRGENDYPISEISYAAGDILLLVTDGMYEQLNSDEEEYGENRLLSTLGSLKTYGNQLSPTSINKILYDDLRAFMNNHSLQDDLSSICIKLN